MQYLKYITIFAIFLAQHLLTLASNYPKTIREKELEKMGSILESKGIIFKPTKNKHLELKTNNSVNKYLWDSTIEVLQNIPLSSTDSNSGIIITEWHIPKKKLTVRFKITVLIKDNCMSYESLDIKIFKQKIENNIWINKKHNSKLEYAIKDIILRTAREKYLNISEI